MNFEDEDAITHISTRYGDNVRVWNIDLSKDRDFADVFMSDIMKRKKSKMSFENDVFVDTGESVMEEMLKPGVLDGSAPEVGGMTFKTRVETLVNVRFKKLHEDAVLPTYAKAGDAGMDCTAVSDPKDKGDYIVYDLGFAVEIPEGYVGLLFPRSSNSKKDLLMCNSVGVIDSGYRGPVQARFSKIIDVDDVNGAIDHFSDVVEDTIKDDNTNLLTNYRDIIFDGDIYKKGDRVCQLMILPYPTIKTQWADELSDTERGDGGFGSSGK